MLAIPTFPFAQRPTFADPKSALVREPRLMVPGMAPVGSVKIDESHPLASGLIDVWLPNIGCRMLKGKIPVTTDTAGRAGSPWGLGAVFGVGKSMHWDLSVISGYNDSSEYRWSAIYIAMFGAVTWQWLSVGVGGVVQRSIGMWNSPNAISFDSATDLYTYSQNNKIVVIGTDYAEWLSGLTSYYVDGKAVATGQNPGEGTRSYSTHIGRRQSADAEHWTGYLYAAFFYRGLLGAKKHAEIARDPYQFLIPA